MQVIVLLVCNSLVMFGPESGCEGKLAIVIVSVTLNYAGRFVKIDRQRYPFDFVCA